MEAVEARKVYSDITSKHILNCKELYHQIRVNIERLDKKRHDEKDETKKKAYEEEAYLLKHVMEKIYNTFVNTYETKHLYCDECECYENHYIRIHELIDRDNKGVDKCSTCRNTLEIKEKYDCDRCNFMSN